MNKFLLVVVTAGISFTIGAVVGASSILNMPLETIAGHKEAIRRRREQARQQREYSYQKSY